MNASTTSVNTEINSNTHGEITRMIDSETIRVIVERYPEVLTVLGRYDMDLCCGGGHTIPEAARLHDVDVTLLREQVEAVIIWTRG